MTATMSELTLATTACVACLAWLPMAGAALAQAGSCRTVPDRNSGDLILQCGPNLKVRPAPGTLYHASDGSPPRALTLDGGALLIEFHPSARQRTFEILTPMAVAAVRGTRWAVETQSDQTSVLTLSGAVAVRRSNASEAVVLHAGEGVDVDFHPGALQVKRWKPERVRALLARFH